MNTYGLGITCLAILIALVTYLAGSCGVTQACAWRTIFDKGAVGLFEPLFLYSLCTIPLGIVLSFIKVERFWSWLHFARWWLPFSVILIFLTPVTDNTWMPLYSLNRESVTWITSGIFVLVSLIILVTSKSAKR